MASITISCPNGGDNVQVHVSGSGSAAQGTICVKGTFSESLFLRLLKVMVHLMVRFFRWLFRQPEVRRASLTGLIIRVRVADGHLLSNPSHDPKLADDVDVAAVPNWCARNVRAPSWSAQGAPLTVYAWLLSGTSTGPGTLEDGPHRNHFFGGGSNPIDCCSGCSSDADPEKARIVAELTSHPHLEVTVPDGPNAGLHRAMAVSSRAWAVTLRGVTYEVCGDGAAALILRSPTSATPCTAVEGSPFSASFPGKVLGAVGDVVVTKA